jgi:hypothetical protein
VARDVVAGDHVSEGSAEKVPDLAFIIGLPRSGTTLLSAILGRHPDVTAPPEPWIMLALQQLGQVNVRHPADSQVLGSAVRAFMPGDTQARAARAAADSLYGHWRRQANARLLIDKTPRYWMILDFLRASFADASYLWIRRNPLDIAASMRSSWGIDLPRLCVEGRADPHLFDLLLGLDETSRFFASPPARHHVIRYEDLVTDPVPLLAELLDHLSLSSGDGIESLLDLAQVNWTASAFGDTKIRATASPHAASINSWQTVFQPDELQILRDAVGSDRLRALGYGDVVVALDRAGTRDNPDAAAVYLERARTGFAQQMSDIAATSSYGVRLPVDVQSRVHQALRVGG